MNGKILNPFSGSFVLRTGVIGKKLLTPKNSSNKKKSIKKPTPRKKKTSPKQKTFLKKLPSVLLKLVAQNGIKKCTPLILCESPTLTAGSEIN